MTKRKRMKLVHEGKYVAEVQVDVEYDETGSGSFKRATQAGGDSMSMTEGVTAVSAGVGSTAALRRSRSPHISHDSA